MQRVSSKLGERLISLLLTHLRRCLIKQSPLAFAVHEFQIK